MMKPTDRTIIIAEIGVNHGGDFNMAMRMIAEAAGGGADYVKFQTFKAENLVCADAARAPYQAANCGGDESQLQMLRRLQLGPSEFKRLAEECRRKGVGFLSSPFDVESVGVLAPLVMDYWKIPSGEITNLPLLEAIASRGGRVILSTGMSTMDEVNGAVAALEAGGIPRADITLLHCNTQYPTRAADVNLRAMDTLRQAGCGAVGFSDHTEGCAAAIAAVARGAAVIEKHFTLDNSLPGPDHKASANPEMFARMVRGIRFVEQALGSPLKHVTDSEGANIGVARKSIVAKRAIAPGETFTPDNITTKRPGTGLSPMLWHQVLGQRATRQFNPDEPITL